MEETYLLNTPGIRKKILAGGTGPLPSFPSGTKLVFHFQTLLDNFERTVIDDSRLTPVPAEIFVGKMFKMEVWETLLMSMRVGEVAEFWCDAVHTGLYPIVSKGMRLVAQGKDPLEGQRHMCGMGNMFNYSTTGWPELDELMREPQPLIFIMELLQVGDPLSYKRESWMMEKDEKLNAVPSLHHQGNALVKQGRFKDASLKYQEAVLLLRTVQSREMPGDADYVRLSRLIIPLVLNYCQCMLELEEYYEVISHATELLERHNDCVKAYYKRAKAYAAVWDDKLARKDFNMVANLDVTLAPLVVREIKTLNERMKEKFWEEKEQYWKMLEKEEKEKEEEEEEEEKEEEEGEKDESTAVTVRKEEKASQNPPRPGDGSALPGDGRNTNAGTVPATDKTSEQEVTTETNQSAQSSVTEGKDWQQMLRAVMFLQDEGNFLIKEQRWEEACGKLKEALEYVDHLQTKKVQFEGEDWESLEKVRLPLTLNLSQCFLELRQYERVVELNDQLLRKHRGNIKGLYQRARAHVALCHEDEARRDLTRLERLDAQFRPVVRQEMKRLGEAMRVRAVREKKNYATTTREKWGPEGSKTNQGRRSATSKNSEKTAAAADTERKKEQGGGGKEEEKTKEGRKEDESAVEGRRAEEEDDKKRGRGGGGEEKTKGKVRFSEPAKDKTAVEEDGAAAETREEGRERDESTVEGSGTEKEEEEEEQRGGGEEEMRGEVRFSEGAKGAGAEESNQGSLWDKATNESAGLDDSVQSGSRGGQVSDAHLSGVEGDGTKEERSQTDTAEAEQAETEVEKHNGGGGSGIEGEKRGGEEGSGIEVEKGRGEGVSEIEVEKRGGEGGSGIEVEKSRQEGGNPSTAKPKHKGRKKRKQK